MTALQAAVSALQKGDIPSACALLEGALKSAPDDPDALQLMGIVHRRLGNLSEAARFFRKSLKINAAQPHTLNNLGITTATLGDLDEAKTCYERAIALAPQFADAHYNLGLLLSGRNEWQSACDRLKHATRLQPKNGKAFEALGIALRENGEHKEALHAAQTAAQLQPNAPSAHHNLGQACMAVGDYAGAASAYERAIELNAADVTWIGLGHAYRSLGRSAESRNAYQKAVELNPANPDAHRLLNEMIWQTGDAPRYLQSFKLALQRGTDDRRLRLAYANELLKIRQNEQAVTELEIVLAASGINGDALDAMARAKSAAGDHRTALEFHARAMETLPESSLILRNYAETLLKEGEHQRAHQITGLGRQRFPIEQGILALHTTAQRLVGDKGYHALVDYAGLAKQLVVEPPPGYPDIETFCADLKAVLETLHATKAHPTDQTLRGGTQTFGTLFLNQSPVLQQFVVQLRKAIASFIAGMPEDPAHPLFARAKRDFAFAGSWSVRLSSGGFHTNHFHPMGWISSAFYVDVPDVAAAKGKHDGWLKMGETNLDLGDREAIQRYIQPKVGTLALFPSYFWHGTVPFESATPRLTIAFDVVPK
ncbi:MAG: tetratricopeptide repeat protein [Alphaproteobacteria bacterium]|nr:tetratricopeptide repeat protein [Alphaproteobacteria bacterium]